MKKNGQLTIRFPEELKVQLRQACEAANTSAAVVIRDLCVIAIPYMTKLGRWVPPQIASHDNTAERLREMMVTELLRNDSPLQLVMETIVDRANSKRRMLAADSRPTYGEASAEQRTRVIVPPAAHGAKAVTGRPAAPRDDRKPHG